MSQNTRKKGRKVSVPGNFNADWRHFFLHETRNDLLEISNSYQLNRDHSITNATPLPSESNSPLAFVPPAIGIAL